MAGHLAGLLHAHMGVAVLLSLETGVAKLRAGVHEVRAGGGEPRNTSAKTQTERVLARRDRKEQQIGVSVYLVEQCILF